MPAMVERLRVGLVLAATLLLAVLVGYFFFARWKDRFSRRDLPQRLGINIQQDSNGFTLSRSEHGQTVFTLHASRAVQMKDGAQADLHDVRIVLYGHGANPRKDTIQGESFGYDPKTEVVTSQAAVTIDLQSPGADSATAGGKAPIHLRTTGLVFDQKTGHASTAQQIDFEMPQLSGTAVGADYDARQGTVDLFDKVRLHLNLDGGPATLNAANAKLDRSDSQVRLSQAELHTGRRDASAAHAVLWLRADDSAEKVTAEGDVRMATPDGTVVTAPHGLAEFDERSRIQTMRMSGGVKLHQPAKDNAAVRDGQAESATADFDAMGKPRLLRMSGGVDLLEATAGAEAEQRRLRAANVEVAFAGGVARGITARGSPVFEQHGQKGAEGDKSLKADVLEATLRDGKAMESLRGTGHTELRQSLAGKESDVSTGDALTARFGGEGSGAAGGIEDAVQRGNVRFERRLAPAKSGDAGDVLVADAQQAEYKDQGETVVLTGDAAFGNPRVTDKSELQAMTEIQARRIELDRGSGEAVADGAVRASYVPRPGAETTHAVAGHAVLLHSAGTVTFTGSPRLWQNGNSVEAAVIVLDQRSQGMTATAGAKSGAAVRTVLVNQGGNAQQKPEQPVRIRSEKLVYSGADRRARFSTAVTLASEDGTVRADQADVFFKPSGEGAPAGAPPAGAPPAGAPPAGAPPAGAPPAGLMSGNVERIVADGDVVFTQAQPRRQGTGQELVYTADDGKYILTGSPGRRPRIEDQQHGTVSGEALQFFSHEERVDVISGGGRTVTTTRVTK